MRYSELDEGTARVTLEGRMAHMEAEYPGRTISLLGDSPQAKLRSLDLLRLGCPSCAGSGTVTDRCGTHTCPRCNRGSIGWRKALLNRQLDAIEGGE